MPSLHSQYESLRQDIRYRNRIIALLGGLLVLFGFAYLQIPKLLNVYMPPDLSRPQTVKPNVVPPSYVYSFAKQLVQQVNYCREDCSRDYQANLDQLRDYLSAACYQDLTLHRQRNASLYNHRTRTLLPVGAELYDPSRVRRLDAGVWEVTVDFILEEHVVGVETRRNRYRYPLRIIHQSLPRERNEYQLVWDGYTGLGPQPVNPPSLSAR